MSVETQNIEIGEGDLSLQYEGENAATDVGGCSDSSLSVKLKDIDVEVGQFIDPVDTFNVARDITFTTILKEDTMRNLVIACGGDPGDIDTANSKEKYEFPANSVGSVKFAELIYVVARVRDKTKFRTVKLYRVKTQGGVEYAFKKDKEVMYKVTFKAYADPNNSGSPGFLEKDNL